MCCESRLDVKILALAMKNIQVNLIFLARLFVSLHPKSDYICQS